MVVDMKVVRKEFIKKLEEMGFELWDKKEDCEVYGRVTYTDGVTSNGCTAEDWEYWEVYDDYAIHLYDTNRSIPGWAMCPYCGQWMTDKEYEEHKEKCIAEIVYFD